MSEINVNIIKDDENAWELEVTISGVEEETRHKVLLFKEYYSKIVTGNNISVEKLVKLSIEFLLERESQSSILSEFDLKIINNYFPEFEDEVKTRF